MDKEAEHYTPTINVEAIPGPSTYRVDKSAISSTNVNISVSNKRAKDEQNKTGNMKMKAMKGKHTRPEDISLCHKRTTASLPLTTKRLNAMVMNSIENMGKECGATFRDISKYMEENYQLNMKLFERCVKICLEISELNGLLHRIDGMADGNERFILKRPNGVKKDTENLLLKERMNTQIGKLKNTTRMTENKNLRGKANNHLPTSEIVVPDISSNDQPAEGDLRGKANNHLPTSEIVVPDISSNDQAAEGAIMTENLEAISGPSTEQIADASSLHENAASVVSMKRTRNTESNTENKKLKTEVKVVPESKNGTVEKLSEIDAVAKYKIKASENVQEKSADLRQKVRNAKSLTK